MKNSQKGSVGAVLLVIALLLLAVVGYLYTKRPQNANVQTEINGTQRSVREDSGVSLPEVDRIKEASPAEVVTPADNFMKTILSHIGASSVDLKKTTLSWNIGGTKASYAGYGFVVNHTKAENMQFAQTWKTTGTVDSLNITARFENELKARGFALDEYNTGDATFGSAVGYVKDTIVCLIARKTTTPPAQIDESGGVASSNTITCAEIPQDYVTVVDRGVHHATLKFTGPLFDTAVTAGNIKVCVMGGSAGNSNSITCNPPSKFNLHYNSFQNLLVVSENAINPRDQNKVGIFSTGCASCTHHVILENLITISGTVLPKKSVLIY